MEVKKKKEEEREYSSNTNCFFQKAWSLRISDKNVRHINSMSLFTILLFPNLMFMSMAGLFVRMFYE